MRALAVLLLVANAAHADPLDDAHALETSLEYDKALAIVDRAIAAGGNSHAVLAQLYLEAGKLSAGLDRAVDAEARFARALELEPLLVLRDDTSPKITAPFDAARARVKPLAIAYERTGERITVRVTSDPAALVHRVVVRFEQGGDVVQREANDGPVFGFDVWARTHVAIQVLDEHGNRLDEHEYEAHDATAPHEHASGDRDTPSVVSRPKTWLVMSGAAVAVGAFCFWRFQVAQDEWNTLRDDAMPHDYSQLRAVEDRGRSWATAANVSFGVAGAIALVAVGLELFDGLGAYPGGLSATPNSIGVAGRF